MLLERRQRRLWTFDLSGPAVRKENKTDEKGDINNILSHGGLKSKCIGIFLSFNV